MITLIVLSLATAFITTYFLLPVHIKNLKSQNILETDVNKDPPTSVPGLGGLIMVFGFMAGVLVSTFSVGQGEASKLMGGVSVILMFSLIGLVDDLLRLSRKKLVLTLLPSVLLLPQGLVDPILSVPGFDLIIGKYVAWLLVPIFVMVVVNFTNMLAGFNGLEAGTGGIMAAALLICAIILNYNQTTIVIILLSSLLGALLGIIPYNKVPARVFPGDVGTYTIGATLAIAASIGDFKFLLLFLLAPHIIDAAMKFATGGIFSESHYYPPVFLDDDRITIRKEAMEEYNSLLRVVLIRKPMSEKETVQFMWIIEVVLGIAVVLLSFFFLGK